MSLPTAWPVPLLIQYIEGKCFTVQANANERKWILHFCKSIEGLACWLLRYSKFDFDFIHRAEIKFQGANAKLRLSTINKNKSPLNAARTLLDINGVLNVNTSITHKKSHNDRLARSSATKARTNQYSKQRHLLNLPVHKTTMFSVSKQQPKYATLVASFASTPMKCTIKTQFSSALHRFKSHHSFYNPSSKRHITHQSLDSQVSVTCSIHYITLLIGFIWPLI